MKFVPLNKKSDWELFLIFLNRLQEEDLDKAYEVVKKMKSEVDCDE